MIIAHASWQFSLEVKLTNRTAAKSEPGRHLFDCQPSAVKQLFFQTFDLGRIADPFDAGGIERFAGAGAHFLLVDDAGNLGVSIFVQERIDLLAHGLMSSAQLLSLKGTLQSHCRADSYEQWAIRSMRNARIVSASQVSRERLPAWANL